MIQEFTIKNFKSIKNSMTFSFEATKDNTNIETHTVNIGNKKLLKYAMILGANASGKTNLLLGFDFYRDYIVNSFHDLKPSSKTGLSPFIFDEKTVKDSSSFSITFFIGEIKYEYTIMLNSDVILYEELYYAPKGQRKLLYIRDVNKKNIYSWGESLIGNRKEISKMTRTNIPFLTTAAQFNYPILIDVYNWFNNRCLSIELSNYEDFMKRSMNTISLIEQNEDMKDKVLDLLSQADLSHINDVEIHKKEIDSSVFEYFSDKFKNEVINDKKPYINEIVLKHKYNETDNNLSLKNESKGTQRFFELCGPLIQLIESNLFLPIDELDTSLHQEVFNFFIETFLMRSNGSQILFTCHNLDILDSELVRKDQVWLCEKDDNTGESKYNCMSEFKGIRKGQSLRNYYLSGKFGAKPITKIVL